MPSSPATETVHHISARRRRAAAPLSMQLNLAAMIDVIFLLLIYFVVTANFTFDEGVLSAKMPQGVGAPRTEDLQLPKRPMRIVLRSTDVAGVRISINQVQPADSFTDLYQQLVALRGSVYAPDNPIIIQPDGQVRWQHVVNAFNAAVRARYTNVSFAAGE